VRLKYKRLATEAKRVADASGPLEGEALDRYAIITPLAFARAHIILDIMIDSSSSCTSWPRKARNKVEY
jgi:hypothetical protein